MLISFSFSIYLIVSREYSYESARDFLVWESGKFTITYNSKREYVILTSSNINRLKPPMLKAMLQEFHVFTNKTLGI